MRGYTPAEVSALVAVALGGETGEAPSDDFQDALLAVYERGLVALEVSPDDEWTRFWLTPSGLDAIRIIGELERSGHPTM